MDDQGFESINVIPFIDIMLVLLTIVLVTSTFIVTGAMDIKLPKASDTPQATLDGVVIEITASGEMTLNHTLMTPAELEQLLMPYPRQTPVLIRADADLPLQGFVTVMDRIKTLGFKKLTLQTEAL